MEDEHGMLENCVINNPGDLVIFQYTAVAYAQISSSFSDVNWSSNCGRFGTGDIAIIISRVSSNSESEISHDQAETIYFASTKIIGWNWSSSGAPKIEVIEEGIPTRVNAHVNVSREDAK